jgi:para-nitrobenzyl esterase
MPDDTTRPLVHTTQGALRGTAAAGVNAFRGIPFAAPPLGPLRFRPAQPAAPWTGERDASAFGSAPMQVPVPLATANPLSEDCLYLNVFAPADPGPHPVFVWVYGGSDFMGEGGVDMFDGTAFAERGVVLVTINYRLSALGWMTLHHLLGPDYAGAANAGLTDIIMALEWVRDEIGAFGGDPSRVTLGGQSVGAKNITSLLASNDDVRGLFQQVILESGTAQCVWDDHAARVMTDNIVRELGLTPDTATEMLTIDPARLVQAFQDATAPDGYVNFNTRVVVDGTLVTSSGLDAARAGRVNGLRVLIGNTHDEYDLFMSQGPLAADPGSDRMDYVATPKMAQDINARYRALRPDLSDADRWFRVMCDEEWWIPNVRYVEALLEDGKGNDVWMYRFDFLPTVGPMGMRACHTAELPLVFNTVGSAYGKAMIGDTPGAQELADIITDAWARFVRGDAPGGGGLPEWPRYGTAGREVMILDHACRIEKDPWGDLRDAWTGVQ